jgi:hypothetical protein
VSKLDDLTIGEARQLAQMFEGGVPLAPISQDLGIRIVILQRGWVVVGHVMQCGSRVSIHDGYVIRHWGTTKGLGQLAVDGPQKDTVLDPVPTVDCHELTIVASIQCTHPKWGDDLCKQTPSV